MQAGHCYVVLLTPPGRGAVATVLVAGERATAKVESHFCPATNKPLSEVPLGRIVFGRWQNTRYSSAPNVSTNSIGEEIVVCRTANNDVEIHCHGGSAASRAIMETLLADGCVERQWRDWLPCTSPHAITANARVALAAATTTRTASLLLDQYHGTLQRELAANVAVCESNEPRPAIDRLQTLVSRGRTGLHLTQPFRVVLAGRPNVGKSSLMNAILGYSRAIVFNEPGTTRDVVTATTAIDGWPVELSDTAGLRSSHDAIETEGVARARRAASEADLLLLIFDAAPPWNDEEQSLVDAYPEALVVINKCDQHRNTHLPRSAFETSALTGEGIAALIRAIGERLVPVPPQPSEAVPFTTPQIDAIERALQLASSGEFKRAADVLRELLR